MTAYLDPVSQVRSSQTMDLVRAADRARLSASASRSAPSSTQRPARRLRAGLRQAVAALATLIAIG